MNERFEQSIMFVPSALILIILWIIAPNIGRLLIVGFLVGLAVTVFAKWPSNYEQAFSKGWTDGYKQGTDDVATIDRIERIRRNG